MLGTCFQKRRGRSGRSQQEHVWWNKDGKSMTENRFFVVMESGIEITGVREEDVIGRSKWKVRTRFMDFKKSGETRRRNMEGLTNFPTPLPPYRTRLYQLLVSIWARDVFENDQLLNLRFFFFQTQSDDADSSGVLHQVEIGRRSRQAAGIDRAHGGRQRFREIDFRRRLLDRDNDGGLLGLRAITDEKQLSASVAVTPSNARFP